ncbi:uncharacterized protein YjiS (DUF1127 family) [Bradyrhizobium sp. USDA 4503]
MPMQNASPSVNPVVPRSQSVIGEAGNGARSHDQSPHPSYPARAVWNNPPSLPPVAEVSSPFASPWQATLEFVIESFAHYGASLHPTAEFPVEIFRAHTSPGLNGAAAHWQNDPRPLEDSNVVEIDKYGRGNGRSSRHSRPLGSLGRMIMTLWANWRREREIKQAVAALSQFDDRTLRDLGIHGRADIERVVRYCHDC